MKNLSKPRAIICDIDGTLALPGLRNPFDYSCVIDDVPNLPIIGLLNTYIILDRENPEWQQTEILLVTGREDVCEQETKLWMEHNGVEYHKLFMRKKGDRRPDYILKNEIYKKHIKGKYTPLFVLEDRDQAVLFWRSIGLTCLQVAPGNF